MIKSLCFLLILVSSSCLSQSYKTIDSLFIVKDYLLYVQNTINSTTSKEEKIAKLDSLIRSSTQKQQMFKKHFKAMLKDNISEYDAMQDSLNFILQSMVLYTSDLKNNNAKSGKTEYLYLNKNIPYLVNKIYYYCRFEKQIVGKKIHTSYATKTLYR